MKQETKAEPVNGTSQGSGRGRTKPFPPMSFDDALILPKSIFVHGLSGNINRLTLLKKIELSPNSSKTRDLISSSYRYGLTTGSYTSPSLNVTDNGRVLLDSNSPSRNVKEKQFELAIRQFDPFNKLYEKLKNQRLPDDVVLRDELGKVEVKESDCEKAAKIFTKNLRFLGLVDKISGSDHVRTIEDVLGPAPRIDDSAPEPSSADSPVETVATVEKNGNVTVETKRPALHIDIQVHIDPTSSAEQIDQIFESMARHLYGA